MEIHYSGFRTPHIHNLSDLVQENLAEQVCRSDMHAILMTYFVQYI